MALVCSTPSWALAADSDGSKPLLCATIDAHFCEVGDDYVHQPLYFRTLPITTPTISSVRFGWRGGQFAFAASR
jgi:hypothetical protein